MEIKGKAHCFFEQSGTFKREFIKLGISAEDYDIQDNFGETDHVVDLFAEIENAYRGVGQSVFDSITYDDIIMAFFPCIYFCENNQLAMSWSHANYNGMTPKEKTDTILTRMENRQKFISLVYKMATVAECRGLRLVIENPWNGLTFLRQNFVKSPDLVDRNRMIRGDYFTKPTAYWFFNCTPTHGLSEQMDKKQKTISRSKAGAAAGLCSEDRSMISPDYARNFICDFILGKEQIGSQLNLFD